MENERTEHIFYLDLKHVHKYGCAKFQRNPFFSSQQTATESAAEEKTKQKKRTKKKKKKVSKPIGDPVGGRDAPISCIQWNNSPIQYTIENPLSVQCLLKILNGSVRRNNCFQLSRCF